MVLITRYCYSALPVYPARGKAFHLLRLMKSVSLEGKKRPVSPAKCNDPNTDYRVFFALRSETGCLCHVNVSAFSHYIIVLLTLSTTSQLEHYSQNHAKKHAFCRFRKQNTCSFFGSSLFAIVLIWHHSIGAKTDVFSDCEKSHLFFSTSI